MRRICPVLIAAALIAPGGALASNADPAASPTQTAAQAKRVFLEHPKVARWLERYRGRAFLTSARLDPQRNLWEVRVHVIQGPTVAVGEVARSGRVVEALVGPEIAWPLGRGEGIGGRINDPLVWLSFCACFLIGLADFRRIRSMCNLDLLALLSFSIYLAIFNEGHVFASAIAAAVSLGYVIARCTWIGIRDRATPSGSTMPMWILIAGLVLLVGFRYGLTSQDAKPLDVGYAGVIGADRLASRETPYGNFPHRTTEPCGLPDEDGKISEFIQDDGWCETANPFGDTYGPVNYHAYLPGLWLFGWSGMWDSLPAVRFTTLLFDALTMLGLAAIGLRFGGQRLALTLAFAWAAYPFTQYAASSNVNDTIMVAFLVWGFWAATSPAGRGVFSALAAWTKLAALIVVPLWLTYPERQIRRGAVFVAAFLATTAVAFWVLFVGGDPGHEIRVFYDRTFEMQLARSSPFSLWDWGDYQADGLPDFRWLQRLLQVAVVVGALALAVLPRRKSALQLAAFSGALIAAFQLVLTHWSGLYIVWFFPFVLMAVVAGSELRSGAAVVE
jgi:hypothetical protein